MWFVGKTGRKVDERGTLIKFNNVNTNKDPQPSFFAAMQTKYGGDTATLRNINLKGDRVTVMTQEEKSKDKEVDHTTEVIGYMVIWNSKNNRVQRNQTADSEPPKMKYKLHTIRRFPLMDTQIYIKTTKFNGKPVEKFGELLTALSKKSPKGYCQKKVNSLKFVGNRKLCGRRASKKNIGF
jgi:hypothetical protein